MSLRAKLDNLDVHGKAFGYNVKPYKSQLIVKENRRESAIKVFESTNITKVDGYRVLGLVIGATSTSDIYMEAKLKKQLPNLKNFSKKAKTSPQNEYSCYTKGVQNKFFCP